MSLSHRGALSSWLPEPPAQADPSTWVSTVHCSALGTLPWAHCSQQDKSAVLGAPGIDLLGSSAPLCSSEWMGFPSFDPLSPMGTVLVTSCSSRAGKQWEGVPADLLSTGIARQGLLLGHCQGDSPQPKPSWHHENGQKRRGNNFGDPLQHFLPAWDLPETDESHGRWDLHASETPTILCRVSTELPHKPSLAQSQTQQAQLSSSLAEHSKGSR